MSTRPYLLLTLRRTGGTSLTRFMQEVSDFPQLQHEPLNPGRIWGDITRTFALESRQDALKKGLEERLETLPNIKHCFDIIAPNITLALIEACAARGYAIFVLTRQNEASRLQSLFLAKATGAWGAKQATKVYPQILSGEQHLEPIDLQKVRRRHAKDAASLGLVLKFLRHRRISYCWYLFEEFYAPDGKLPERACAVANQIGAQIAPDDTRLDAFAERSGQDSARILRHLPNAGALKDLLEKLCLS